jgi:hypothetical protein
MNSVVVKTTTALYRMLDAGQSGRPGKSISPPMILEMAGK